MEQNNKRKEFQKKERRMPAVDLSAMVYGKVPPQARELEEAVLGACMLEPGALDVAMEILKPECFYVDAHQRVFRAFLFLISRERPVDLFTVVEALKASEELDIVGGPYALTKLTNVVKSGAHIESHCRYVLEKFISREVIRISGEAIALAYEDSSDAFETLDYLEGELMKVAQHFSKNDFKTSEQVGIEAMARIDNQLAHTDQLTGAPTGFPYMDLITNGWQPTDLIILAARPSVGKTAFALNLAINAAKNERKPTPTAFFSLEMSSAQLANRILSAESGIFLEKINRADFDSGDYERVYAANLRFGQMPIFVDDTAALTIIGFRSKARRLVSKHGVGLIIIDYLQLMSGTGSGNREQEISNISRNLKVLAKELNITIIALSQMSRAVETRKGDPMLSDLRESGAIEQDADMVMFLYRPDYQQSDDEGDRSLKGKATVKIAKHRNGPLDKIAFDTQLSIQKFSDPVKYTEFEVIQPPKAPAPASDLARLNFGKKFKGGFDGIDLNDTSQPEIDF